MAIIQKTQFKDYVDFSDNINDKKLNYHINDAELFDFSPLVPQDFYNNIKAMVVVNPNQWNRTTAYATGSKVFSPVDQKKYIALRPTVGDEPSISSSDWSEIELWTLFDDYIKGYLVCSAFTRYLLWAGRNISQFGIRVNSEDSSAEVSDKARAELIADIDNKKKWYWSRFKKKISDDDYTYDGVTYDFLDCDVSHPRPNFKIRAV